MSFNFCYILLLKIQMCLSLERSRKYRKQCRKYRVICNGHISVICWKLSRSNVTEVQEHHFLAVANIEACIYRRLYRCLLRELIIKVTGIHFSFFLESTHKIIVTGNKNNSGEYTSQGFKPNYVVLTSFGLKGGVTSCLANLAQSKFLKKL